MHVICSLLAAVMSRLLQHRPGGAVRQCAEQPLYHSAPDPPLLPSCWLLPSSGYCSTTGWGLFWCSVRKHQMFSLWPTLQLVMGRPPACGPPPGPSLAAGADSLRGDKLGSFMMSIEGGHAEAVRFMKQFGVPMLVTGGRHAPACSSPTSEASCCVLSEHWALASWSVRMGSCSSVAWCIAFA